MKIEIHPDAISEILDAAAYYKRHKRGLGDAFLEEVNSGIQRIRRSPKQYAKISGEVRRHIIGRRFPYGILYRIFADHIRVLAVSHLRRKPDYWKYRE
jgi:plasmid stabilization system protein ParE